MHYLCHTNVGFSHLLINLTNLTSGVRSYPKLRTPFFFSCDKSKSVSHLMLSKKKIYSCYLASIDIFGGV